MNPPDNGATDKAMAELERLYDLLRTAPEGAATYTIIDRIRELENEVGSPLRRYVDGI